MRLLPFCISLLVLAGSGAAARDAGALRAAGDPTSAARLAAVFGTVTSTYRTVAHNRSVGGVPNSYHLSGRAIDVARRPGVTHDQIAAALRRAGYRLIESLDEGDHSHFAFGSPGGPPAVAQRTAIGTEVKGGRAPRVERRLLADDHGTLLLDLQTASRTAGATGAGR